MKIFFITFGCKLNQAETEILEEKFLKKNWFLADNYSQAEVVVINSCVVTQKSEKEVRQKIHQTRRSNPKCFLTVIGCFTKEMKDKEKESVNLWVGNKNKNNLDKKIQSIFKSKKQEKNYSLKTKNKTRALIKIQSGCLNYCSYCIVPFLRNEIISRTCKDIVEEILKKRKQGFKEVVLTGTNISVYFCPKEKIDFIGLLKMILKKTDIERIRLSSFWPAQIKKDLIDLIKKQPRLCRHLHLSIQSASSSVLKKMNRNYTETDLKNLIFRLKEIKGLNLTADFIVGFPGETRKDFQKTKDFIKKAGFLKIHVFRFSSRPGTKASEMEDDISVKEKQRRSRELIFIGEKTGEKRKKCFFNKSKQVLFEQKINGYWQGFTENYLKVFLKSKINLKNKIVSVKLEKFFRDGIIGKIQE